MKWLYVVLVLFENSDFASGVILIDGCMDAGEIRVAADSPAEIRTILTKYTSYTLGEYNK